jgi:hypothetical protein
MLNDGIKRTRPDPETTVILPVKAMVRRPITGGPGVHEIGRLSAVSPRGHVPCRASAADRQDLGKITVVEIAVSSACRRSGDDGNTRFSMIG